MATKMQERYEKREKMFYKTYAVVLIVCTVLGFLVLGNPLEAEAGTIKSKRTAYGQVVDVSPKDKTVYILTRDGNLWFINEADFEVGDIVKVYFRTQRTKRKQDDKIYKVIYKCYCDYQVF